MKKFFAALLITLLSAHFCFAAGNNRITLNDGTTIYGKVVGMSDGVYTIRTETMGEIKVNSDNVVEITSNTAPKKQSNIDILEGNERGSRNNNYSGNNNSQNNYSAQQKDANARVQSMMMNEDFMNNLMQLSESSEMQSILNDPEIMEAIQNGDYDFLMNNSKMNDLMNSSGIQEILGDM